MLDMALQSAAHLPEPDESQESEEDAFHPHSEDMDEVPYNEVCINESSYAACACLR
jgi:hypothetical protein